MKIFKVVFYCLLCAILFASISAFTKNLNTEWKEHLLLIVTIVITLLLTTFFTKWEKLTLTDVGIIPHKRTLSKLIIGFGIGLFMSFLQPVLIYIFGHNKIAFNPSVSYIRIIFYLTLYILVALREELAFRSYPMFSLNYGFGLWKAQLIILIIFSFEHIAGGMTWIQAFLGSGTGALLFGFAALKSNGIALPIGIHTAWNFGQWCFGFKKDTGLFKVIVDKGFEDIVDRNGWVSYLLIMIFAISAFSLYKPQISLKSDQH